MTRTTSKELIAWRNRVLDTPKHLREFEEECGLRGISDKIRMAENWERQQAEAVRKIELRSATFQALMAVAGSGPYSAGRKNLINAVGDLYLYLSA